MDQRATYVACTKAPAQATPTVPACRADGLPDLPPGRYSVQLATIPPLPVPPPVTVTILAPSTGTVTGYIDACGALPPSPSAAYTGGTVVALHDSRQIARQKVPTGHKYRFTLPPGTYTIQLPHYIGGNVGSQVNVSVKAGNTTHANLPNACK